MYGALVYPPSDPEFAEYTASSCSSRLRLKQRRTHNRAQICWLNRWCTSLLIMLSCGLLFVLSGCGNPQVNAGNTGTLVASPNTVTFGSVSIGQSASTTVSLANGNSAPVEISQLSMTGQSFSVAGTRTLPVTIAAGETYNLNVQFNPATEGAATGQLTIASLRHRHHRLVSVRLSHRFRRLLCGQRRVHGDCLVCQYRPDRELDVQCGRRFRELQLDVGGRYIADASDSTGDRLGSSGGHPLWNCSGQHSA